MLPRYIFSSIAMHCALSMPLKAATTECGGGPYRILDSQQCSFHIYASNRYTKRLPSMMSLNVKSAMLTTTPKLTVHGVVRPRTLRLVARAQSEKKDQGDQLLYREETPNDTRGIEAGNLSNENAERRAEVGKERSPDFLEAQSFDGPAPETINSRLAMIGVVAGLGAEFGTGLGLKEQVSIAPVSILATFVLISLASYVPIARGFTRKEPYSNGIWTPKAENWNGRLAMIGFTAIIVTEALTGQSTIATYGLPHNTLGL